PIEVKIINEKKYSPSEVNVLKLKIEGEKLIIKSGKSDKEIVTGFGKTINLPFANIIIIKNKKYNFQSAKNIKTDDLELYISSL
ncbi:hypothetical protein SB776_39165, partial [Burkholderia sp. SIMBA_045]